MSRSATSVDEYAYATPDPVTVARILAGYGMDAVAARWPWKSTVALGKIAQQGREIMRGQSATPVRPARRAIPVETEERILHLARALGSSALAAQGLGVSESLVRTIHRERGLPIPTLPAAVRCAKSAATLKARRAGGEAKPAPAYAPRSCDAEAVLAAWRAGRTVKEIAAEQGCSIAPIYRVLSGRGAIKGVPKKLPPDDVIRADLLAGMGQHAMAKKYGTTRGTVCHRIAAMGLQGASAIPRSTRKLPDDQTLRADRLAGLTLRAAAARYGVSRSVVGKHWKRLGLAGWASDLTLEMKEAA